MDTADLLKELQTLQMLYKSNWDLAHQSVIQQAEKIEKTNLTLQEAVQQIGQIADLTKQMIAEFDAQMQRMIKITAALVQISNDLTTRFAATSGNGQ